MNKPTLLCVLIAIILLSSCTDLKEIPAIDLSMRSSLTRDDIVNSKFEFEKFYNEKGMDTRSEEVFVNEDICRDLVKQYTNDGELIRLQILSQKEKLSSEDIEFYENMPDDMLAYLSLFSIAYSEEGLTRSDIDWGRVRNCVGVALGVAAIKEIGVKGVITAATLRQAIFALAKRYAGYVGVALMVWDFYDCVS